MLLMYVLRKWWVRPKRKRTIRERVTTVEGGNHRWVVSSIKATSELVLAQQHKISTQNTSCQVNRTSVCKWVQWMLVRLAALTKQSFRFVNVALHQWFLMLYSSTGCQHLHTAVHTVVYLPMSGQQSSFSIWWCTETALGRLLVTVLKCVPRVMFEITQMFKEPPVDQSVPWRGWEVLLCVGGNHFNRLQTTIKSLSLVPLRLKESESTAFNDFLIFIGSFKLVLQGRISAARLRIKQTPRGNAQLSLMEYILIIIIRSIHALMMGQQYY